MKVTWYGHACFLFDISGNLVLVDPFFKENPLAPIGPDQIKKVDVLLITHDHFDHLGDALEIFERTNAKTTGTPELMTWLTEKGVKNAVGANIGGTVRLNDISVTLVSAAHTCQVGVCLGFVVSSGDESVYHAGDTSLISDMKVVGDLYKPRVACLPIGGHYTMDIDAAMEAVKMIKPQYVIPMHYGTFDAIKADVNRFERLVKEKTTAKPIVLKPGEEAEI
ncbi:MAG: metal-dependent hydrolase [Nitrososphaeria archaeon]|nr:metal-dependent hydrolase [Nitrososphaeria archaeon]NIQ33947.1 metal-dependent hydrolase [Nitrososphaeria archaeon]